MTDDYTICHEGGCGACSACLGVCFKCRRRRGIGCACDLTFSERIKTVRANLANLKAARR